MSQKTQDFFSGGGEMGELIRATDWSQTLLGPIEKWPQSLRSALSICLGSAFPIAIYWGKELTLLYNDAWSPIPGDKHPGALGKPAIEVWPEIWPDIEPLFRQVMQTGEASRSIDALLPMQRHGYTEECYFDFTFTPIRGEANRIDGIFNAVIETTYRVISERRASFLRELSQTINRATSVEEIAAYAKGELDKTLEDVPFSLLYLNSEDNQTTELIGISGTAPKVSEQIDLSLAGGILPFAEVLESGESFHITNNADWFGAHLRSAWPEPSTEALILPVGLNKIIGFLIAGINPRRALDTDYHNFLKSITAHLANMIFNVRSLEEERRRSEKLEEIDRDKTLFFSDVSHEFRTPLTLMLSPVQELLKSVSDVQHRETLELIYRNGLRLQKLVNNLLDFSRIGAGRVKASYTPLDIATLTADLASNFRSIVERAQMKFIVSAPKLSGPVYVDPDMWEKIVLNLLSNAFKYTLQGEIEVAVMEQQDTVELKVRDTGEGIPKDQLTHIFDRFKRVEGARSRSYEGSGIGLSLVQELVKLHHGTIQVDSLVGKGTTFTVTLPKGKQHLPPEQVQTSAKSTSSTEGIQSIIQEAEQWIPEQVTLQEVDHVAEPFTSFSDRPIILLADDNADMRQYIQRLLSGQFVVLTVANGKQALELAEKRLPDLVITDVMMPEMDGFSLLAILKGNLSTARIPVMMLSARTGEEARVEGLKAGADDYLIKPFAANELIARVTSLIMVSRTRYETEDRLYDLFMQAPAFIAVIRGPDHVFDLANSRYMQLVGRNRKILGKTVAQALPEVVEQGFVELLDKVYQTGELYTGNEILVKIDQEDSGELTDVYLNFIYNPYRDSKGITQGILVHGVEVTEQVINRKRIEESEKILRERINQQAVITDLGLLALRGTDLSALMDAAVKQLREVLNVEYTKILELLPGGKRMLLRAGVGWHDSITINQSTVDTGKNSQAGYTLLSNEPVIVRDLRTEIRFNGPLLLRDHQVVSGMSCIIWGRNQKPYGVLGVHTTREKAFTKDDVNFLQAVANVLATAIRRSMDDEELRYHATINQNIADAVIGADLDFRIRSWNKGAERLYGWKKDEVRGKSATDILKSEFGEPGMREKSVRALQETGFWSGEVIHHRKDGSPVAVHGSVTLVRNIGGQPIGIVAVNRDITERKKTEDILRQSELTFKTYTEAMPQMAFMADAMGNITYYNQRWYDFVGEVGTEGWGWKDLQVLHPDDLERTLELWQNSLKTGDSYEIEYRIRRYDGQYCWHLGRAVPVRNGQGQVERWLGTNTDIHAHKLAEEALKKSEEYYKTLMDNTPVMTWITQPDGYCSYMSKSWYDYSGQTSGTALGMKWFEAVHPEDRDQCKTIFGHANKRQIPYHQEYRIRSEDGMYRWYLDSGSPRFDEQGNFEGFVGSMVDIHERKIMEDRLRESEGRFRTLADNISQLAWMTDETGWIFWYNKRWYDFTGTNLEEMQGWGWQKVHHPNHVARVVAKFSQAIQNEEVWEDTFPLRSKQGDYRWFLSRAIPIRDGEGKILHWFGTNTDINDLRLTEDALKKSEEFSRTLIESTPDCVKALDLKGRLLSMNGQGQKMLGIEDFSEYRNKYWMELWTGEFYDQAVKAYNTARTGGIGHFQGSLATVQGTMKWWDVMVAPIYGAGGKVDRLVAVSRDITKLKSLEQQKDDFISIASHELKTPVTSLKAYAQILQKRFQKGEDTQAVTMLEKMDSQLNRLTNLITDLLDVTKIEQGKLQFVKEYFNFNDLVKDVVEEIQRTFPTHQIRLKLDTDVELYADRDRIGQVIINLLTNAIKYSPRADNVEVNTKEVDERLQLSVRDYGVGIAAHDLDRVFERFYRAEGSGFETYPGLGLGLFISAGIIHRHRGDVWVESQQGQGATFYFSLPLNESETMLAGNGSN